MTDRILFNHGNFTSYYNSNPWTRGFEGVPQQDMILWGIWFRPAGTETTNSVQPEVYRVSDQAKISTASQKASKTYSAGNWYYHAFDIPVPLTAGVAYRFSIFGSSSPAVDGSNAASAHTHSIVDNGTTLTVNWIQEAVSSGVIGTYPNTVSNAREPALRLEVSTRPVKHYGLGNVGDYYNNMSSLNYTYGQSGKFSKDVVLKSIVLYAANNGSHTITPVVYQVTGNALIAKGNAVSATASGTENGLPLEFAFSTPPTLLANEDYYIGFYNSSSQFFHTQVSTAAGTVWTASENFCTFTKLNAGYSRSSTTGDMAPTTVPAAGEEMRMMMKVEQANTLPTAPTGVTASDVTSPAAVPVSWTHNDPDGNPQYSYQMRWRKV